jgi:anti-anti-sigma factor
MARDASPVLPEGAAVLPEGAPVLPEGARVVSHGAVEIYLSGDIDVSNASVVLDQVHEALASEPECVILDASGVTFMSSSGVSALLASDRWCKAANVPLVLRAPSRQVLRLLQLTATTPLFDIRS